LTTTGNMKSRCRDRK